MSCPSASQKSIWDSMFNVDILNANENNQDIDNLTSPMIMDVTSQKTISQLNDLLGDLQLVEESKRLLRTDNYDI